MGMGPVIVRGRLVLRCVCLIGVCLLSAGRCVHASACLNTCHMLLVDAQHSSRWLLQAVVLAGGPYQFGCTTFYEDAHTLRGGILPLPGDEFVLQKALEIFAS